MIIELAPDYDLFIKILFVLWVVVGAFKFLLGLVHADKPNQDKYGTIEVVDGLLVLILASWIVTS